MLNELELADLWIDAIPEDNYAICPCGCGKKWKYAKREILEGQVNHEENFYNMLTKQNNNDMVLTT